MESYILENNEMLDKNILYSCLPIEKDVILYDMTDMKPGTAYEFVGRLPDFLRQKKNMLKSGDWDRVISFPKEPGVYVAVVSVYDGIDNSFVLIYDCLDPHQSPNVAHVGTIRKPRTIGVALAKLRLWLAARKYRKSLYE